MMNVKNIMLSVAFVLVGCGSDEPDAKAAFSEYMPTIDEPVPFRLPAGSDSMQITQDQSGNVGVFSQSSYQHPNKWVIYMASAPWVKEGSSDFTSRAVNDTVTGEKVMSFLHDHNFKDRVDFVWMQYDALPKSKDEGWGGMKAGSKLPGVLWAQNTHSIFDAYVISPAARYPGQAGLLYSDWIRPFITYPDGDNGAFWRSLDVDAGIDKVDSDFWDRWGRHFFIVDPEGMVRDAYVSMNRDTSELQAMRSIAHHLGADLDDDAFPDFVRGSAYKAYYSPTLEGQFYDTMNLIDEGLRGE
ncbi:hypothetical protein QAO71_17235 (plasmid) [Halopseudomonas sp. SMJS2]|uniref:hypothetical protein n=1 Tax=Halopseudomonas sp. SMJS2 TaxID=3041098 RepID=UPI002453094B|nr:hypothetical protein [Halopseudomonas sp. SMJS2]WGK63512.1 hypothetical protein QAO71_17235 [Halopseudomonas sp. SMJS2]